MPSCPDCQSELPPDAVSCPRCGRKAGPDASLGATDGPTQPYAVTHTWSPSVSATDTITPPPAETEVLPPGTVIHERYRILNLLGKGGMGAVYRALDEKLDQEVALKFIAASLIGDHRAVTGLVNEVKLARRVAHSHVCRVYDLGEYGGRTFISMEYVDGEDLSSLLRRIGRLPGDKAVQLARQLCAGLNALHERRVLHRDLKPANVMVDGDGNVRITDFGIAAAAEGLVSAESSSGTPAYMAPELFTGGQASVRSDIYALGLVLYEVFTGQPLFQARSMTELLQHHRRPVQPPTQIVRDIDPDVEHVIMQCLSRDPDARPASAMAVLAALPGGDPLASALASGRTPSPEVVAAAGGSGTMTSRAATGLVVAMIVGIILLLTLEPRVKLFARSELPKSTEVLADRAAETLRSLRYETAGTHTAYGFEVDEEYLRQIEAHEPTQLEWQERLKSSRPTLLDFWFRSVPKPNRLEPTNIKGRVRWDDPAAVIPGNVQVRLDPSGRLRELLVIPARSGVLPVPRDQGVEPTVSNPNWSAAFEAAGLDLAEFEPVPPAWLPHTFADQRAAWTGRYPEPPHIPVRIEAAALDSMIVGFRIIEQRWPDTQNTATAIAPMTPIRSWRFLARIVLVLAAIALAWSTIQRRRGDPRGALRVGAATFSMVAAFTMLGGNHSYDAAHAANLLVKGMMHGLVVGAEFALYYFALEPHVRRTWPETIISWSRLIAGRWRDPLVGHHVIMGMALSVTTVLIAYLRFLIPRWMGQPEPRPAMFHDSAIEALTGLGSSLGSLLEITVDFARNGMTLFMSLVVLKLVLRHRGVSASVATLVWAFVFTQNAPVLSVPFLCNAALAGAIVLCAIRVGLLATLVGYVFFGVFTSFPMQLDPNQWYSQYGILALGLAALATVCGLRTATRRF